MTHYDPILRYFLSVTNVTYLYCYRMDNDKNDLFTLTGVRAALLDGRAKEAREQARLTQAEMGHALSVAPSTISGWENGRRQPGTSVALRYAEVLAGLGLVVVAGQRTP